jgi:hypothetical protein
MNRQKENNISLIERFMMIGLFLFIIFLLRSTDCTDKDSFYYTTYRQGAAIEHIIAKSPSLVSILPDFNSPIVACEIFTFNACNKNNFNIICSNNKVNQLLKNCQKRFLVIKPQVLDFDSYHNRTSLNNEEISLIS